MSEFLSKEDVRRLTGKAHKDAQIRWLNDHGYKIDINGLGEPILSVREFYRRKGGAAFERQQEPNWGALRGQA